MSRSRRARLGAAARCRRNSSTRRSHCSTSARSRADASRSCRSSVHQPKAINAARMITWPASNAGQGQANRRPGRSLSMVVLPLPQGPACAEGKAEITVFTLAYLLPAQIGEYRGVDQPFSQAEDLRVALTASADEHDAGLLK